MRQCSVIIIEDQDVFRIGLHSLLARNEHLACVGSTNNGTDAVVLALRQQPQIAIMNMNEPEGDGIDTLAQMQAEVPDTQVIVYSLRPPPPLIAKAFRLGARAYVCRASCHSVFMNAVSEVEKGQRFIDPNLANSMLNRLTGENEREPTAHLSTREQQVLLRVSKGYSNADIAAELNLSAKTIESYRARACQKLDLADRPAIVKFAIASGWLCSGSHPRVADGSIHSEAIQISLLRRTEQSELAPPATLQMVTTNDGFYNTGCSTKSVTAGSEN